ncbi:MAG: heme-binding protein [Pseudolysinimonas sp.]|uniref:SOUL family heme-binding protein n=1 Tax=Pseudolysinimonas sp. TaxID=2680009 RepID=UPI00326632F1
MTEQQPFDLVQRYDTFELRRYPAHVLAEVTVDAAFDDAGNRAFRYLFGYITGDNRARQSLAMTAPVVQSEAPPESVKLAMTAPVVQQTSDSMDGYRVAFVLPADVTLDQAPVPTNPAVHIREIPAALVAAIRFSGRWSEARFRRHLDILRRDLTAAGLVSIGEPRFARFDPPFLPSFLRHNEVVLDIAEKV